MFVNVTKKEKRFSIHYNASCHVFNVKYYSNGTKLFLFITWYTLKTLLIKNCALSKLKSNGVNSARCQTVLHNNLSSIHDFQGRRLMEELSSYSEFLGANQTTTFIVNNLLSYVMPWTLIRFWACAGVMSLLFLPWTIVYSVLYNIVTYLPSHLSVK